MLCCIILCCIAIINVNIILLIKLLSVLVYCCKTRVKLLVFDRLGLPPYPCISQLSPLYSLPCPF